MHEQDDRVRLVLAADVDPLVDAADLRLVRLLDAVRRDDAAEILDGVARLLVRRDVRTLLCVCVQARPLQRLQGPRTEGARSHSLVSSRSLPTVRQLRAVVSTPSSAGLRGCELGDSEAVRRVEVEHLALQCELLGLRLELVHGVELRRLRGLRRKNRCSSFGVASACGKGLSAAARRSSSTLSTKVVGVEAELLLDAALDLAGEPCRRLGAAEDDVAALDVSADVLQPDAFELLDELTHRQRPDAATHSAQ